MNNLGAFLPLLLIVAFFYLLVLRPARARQAAQRAVVAQLEPGVEVMTTAGLYGRIQAVQGDDVLVEIAPGVTVKYVAAAIAKVVPVPVPESVGTLEDSRPSIIEGDTPGS